MSDTTDPTDASVLIVDDDEAIADMYEKWLAESFDTGVVYGGKGAIDKIDNEYDVVFLDRKMPCISGDDVLEYIRDEEFNIHVVMVTGVEPDFDILDMGFDDYLIKPVDGHELIETVHRMLSRKNYSEKMEELQRLSTKFATIKSRKQDHEVENNERAQEISNRIKQLEQEIDQSLNDFDSEDFKAVFYDL